MRPLDLLVHNVRIIDVHLLSVYLGWVGISGGRFIYVESGEPPAAAEAAEKLDAGGMYLAPGLIDSHMHIESSLLTPRRFSEAIIPHGTTTVLADAHEVANVAGEEGVRRMIEEGSRSPLSVYHAVPSCVPATSDDLEWARGRIEAGDLDRLAEYPGVIALGEMMDGRSVLDGSPRHTALLRHAAERGLLREGHIPTLRGAELSEYLSYGISSDHTLAYPEKIREQVGKGVAVMLQYKSLQQRNITAVMELEDRSSILLVTDDIEPTMLRRGHLSTILQTAVSAGLPPMEAYASATIRPARYLRLADRGSIRPGARADFMLLSDFLEFPPEMVYLGGRLTARRGQYTGGDEAEESRLPATEFSFRVSMRHLSVPDELAGKERALANAVTVQSSITTETGLKRLSFPLQDGFPRLDAAEDAAAAAVISRDGELSSLGIIEGTGLRRGAYAASFAHDSHNILVIGLGREEMRSAAQAVTDMGGGIVFTERGDTAASLPLPCFGLISDEPCWTVAERLERIEEKLRENGVRHSRPFLFFSILSLSVSPYYKFSVRGIIDTERRRLVPSWEEEE